MQDIINKIAATGKGILAADESTPTITKRLESVGIESTPENRHYYRHALFSLMKLLRTGTPSAH